MTNEDIELLSEHLVMKYKLRINLYVEFTSVYSMSRAVCTIWLDGVVRAWFYYFEEIEQTFEDADLKVIKDWSEKIVESTLNR